jgi:hypothetical protein
VEKIKNVKEKDVLINNQNYVLEIDISGKIPAAVVIGKRSADGGLIVFGDIFDRSRETWKDFIDLRDANLKCGLGLSALRYVARGDYIEEVRLDIDKG